MEFKRGYGLTQHRSIHLETERDFYLCSANRVFHFIIKFRMHFVINEDILQLMSTISVKPEAKESANTLLGFEIFRSSSPMFHYQRKQKTLAGFELFIYDQKQTAALTDLISKVAKPIFKQTGPSKTTDIYPNFVPNQSKFYPNFVPEN